MLDDSDQESGAFPWLDSSTWLQIRRILVHVLFGIVLPLRSRCRLLKHATTRSQVATSGVDLEIPSGPPWIKRTPLPGTPTVDRI